MTAQIRTTPNGPLLSPTRDLAYQFVEIISAGMKLLMQEYLRPEDEALMDQIGSTAKGDVMDCAERLGNSITRLVGPNKAADVQTALRDAGYLNTDARVRFLIEAAIGRALFSFGCHALRDVTYAGFNPPQECKLQTALITANFIKDPAAFEAATKKIDVEQLSLRLLELEIENERLRKAIQYDRSKLDVADAPADDRCGRNKCCSGKCSS